MRSAQENDLFAILRTLAGHEVRFIVVGGVSAVLQGAPVTTFDIDVVHDRDTANVTRLIRALEEMGSIYRIQPSRMLRPEESHLLSGGHQLLMTRHGPLDVLGEIGQRRTYADLLPDAEELEIEPGLTVHVLSLARLIAVKQEAPREKDEAVLPILKRTLEERNRRG